MRILHIHKYAHEHDGVGRYISDVMRLTQERGGSAALLAMHHPKNAPSPWSPYFVHEQKTARVERGRAALAQFATAAWNHEAYQATLRIIADFAPDVIHAHNLYTHLSPSVLFAAKHARVPVVLTAHDYGYISANYGLFAHGAPLAPTASWYEVMQSAWIKHSRLATGVLDALVRVQRATHQWSHGVSRMLVASEHMKKAYISAGYDARNMTVLPLPAGPLVAHIKPSSVLPKKNAILFAGRFEENKGMSVLLDLARRIPDVTFLCVGKRDAERTSLTHIPKNITQIPLMPPQKLWALMREVRGVLMPTLSNEPFGLVALEALACGTPAIVSNRGGLPEIVEDEVSGMVCDPEKSETFEEAIRTLTSTRPSDEKKIVTMRKAAFRRAVLIGDPNAHSDALDQVYRSVYCGF